MKAIETTYHGPTTCKGARIKADDGDGNTVWISYPYASSREAGHRAAADALLTKMGWTGKMVGGATKRGYVFVFVD